MNLEETVDAVGKYIKLGYKAIRAQSGIPGMQSTYGIGRGDMYYEPPKPMPRRKTCGQQSAI